MEAPKSIYLCPNDSVTTDYEEEWLEYPWGENSVEYIRADTFIDKAWSWMEDNVLSSNQQSMYYKQQFRNYMKEE